MWLVMSAISKSRKGSICLLDSDVRILAYFGSIKTLLIIGWKNNKIVISFDVEKIELLYIILLSFLLFSK